MGFLSKVGNSGAGGQTGRPGKRISRYLLYAVGEISLIVIGILIALQISNWNARRQLVQKELAILRAFDHQLQNDLGLFDESLAFNAQSEESLDILLHSLENDLDYTKSLDDHFCLSTRIFIGADMAGNVFESLKSAGVELISNEHLRSRITLLYEDDDSWIRKFEDMYTDFIMRASEELFPMRFVDFWNGDHTDPQFVGCSMTPLDFEALKQDQEYLYFLRTQKNHMGWLIKRPIADTRKKIQDLQLEIRQEIRALEANW